MWPTLRRVAALAGHTKVRQLLSRVLEDGHDFCCWHFSDVLRPSSDVRCWGIVLQKSRVAAVQIFGENLKRKEVDDSHSLSRATEVAYEFGARR